MSVLFLFNCISMFIIISYVHTQNKGHYEFRPSHLGFYHPIIVKAKIYERYRVVSGSQYVYVTDCLTFLWLFVITWFRSICHHSPRDQEQCTSVEKPVTEWILWCQCVLVTFSFKQVSIAPVIIRSAVYENKKSKCLLLERQL